MAMNRIQFQHGMSLVEFQDLYGSELQCAQALERWRWPNGFVCPRCSLAGTYCLVRQDERQLFQCGRCRRQTSLTAGTLMDSTKLALRIWFLAIYLVSQAKTGVSALSLKRQVGVSYRTAWLLHQKIMRAMADSDAQHPLCGQVLVDDAYLGGERRQTPGTAGRGSPNKVPFVAAVAVNNEGHPLYAKMSQVPGFTKQAITHWAKANLQLGSDVLSDGLACFAGVIEAGCSHSYLVVAGRKPEEVAALKWVNVILGNLKTAFAASYKGFKYLKYAKHYLGAFSYRINHRFDLRALVGELLQDAALAKPCRQWQIRGMA
jgi:Zn ribbon nucleic-acid-binding protein